MKKCLSLLTFTALLFLIQIPVTGFGYENPGEMAFSDTIFELQFPEPYGDIGNNLLNMESLNADLTVTGAKEDFLGQMEDGVFRCNLNGGINTGFTIGRFKLNVRPWTGSSLTLGKSFTDIIFVGLEPNKEYSLNNTGAKGMAAVSTDITYGHPTPLEINGHTYPLGVGVTFHYLYGLAVADTEIVDGKITTNEIGEATYLVNKGYYYYGTIADPGFGGQGFLIDLGVNYRENPWHAGVVLKNIGPGVTWSGVTGEKMTGAQGSVVVASHSGPEFFPETNDPNVEEITSFKSNVPLVLMAHGAYYLFPTLNLNFGVEKGFDDGWGISKSPKLWTGLDWETRFLRLAGEFSLQSKQLGIDTLLQLRLWFLWLKLNIGWTGGFTAEQIKGLTGALSMALHF